MRGLLVAALLLGIGLAGCIDGSDATTRSVELPSCSVPEAYAIPDPSWQIGRRSDANQTYDTLVWFPEQEWPYLDEFEVPNQWFFNYRVLSASDGQVLVRIRADPPWVDPEAGGGLPLPQWKDIHVRIAYADEDYVTGDCRIEQRGEFRWELGDATDGEVAMPGKGAHVRAAGFWENGTMFWTNIQEVHDSDWPRAGWYEYSDDTPLPVYVYDQVPEERSALWAPPPDPVTNEPLWAYYTTIAGFNEALKGLSTTTARVVHMDPEQAYTRDGNEQHVLYGDALIFYIVVEDVVTHPCPAGVPAGACSVAPAPAAPWA